MTTTSALLKGFSISFAAMAALLAAFCFGAAPDARGNDADLDWPHWRGPNRDGISLEKDWLGDWPAEGPKILWKASLGTGFSSIAVDDGLIFTMGNTAKKKKDDNQRDVVFCFDALTGSLEWKHEYPALLEPLYYNGGPSATPTIEGDSVYTFGKHGQVFCLEKKTGKVKWSRDVKKEEGLVPPKWGFAGSVLLVKDMAILNAGSAGIALNKKTGKTIWKSANEGAGYSTPLPFEAGGFEGISLYGAKKLMALDPKDGKVLWSHPWITSYDVNASEPIFVGDEVFVSTGYKTGCALLKIADASLTEVWRNKEMSNQCNSCVLWDGHLYGFDGNVGGKGILKCVEFATGETKWAKKGLGTGSVMLADGKLIVLGEGGLLTIATVTPDDYVELRRAQILKGRCWTVPVLWQGKIYARDAAGNMVCVDVKGAAPEEGDEQE